MCGYDKRKWGQDNLLGNKELKLQDVRKSGEVTEMLDLQSPDGTHGPKLQVRLRFEAQTPAPGTSSSAPPGDLLVCEFAAGRKAAPVLLVGFFF